VSRIRARHAARSASACDLWSVTVTRSDHWQGLFIVLLGTSRVRVEFGGGESQERVVEIAAGGQRP